MLKKRCCLNAGRRAKQRLILLKLLAALHFLHQLRSSNTPTFNFLNSFILHVKKTLLHDRRQAGEAATLSR